MRSSGRPSILLIPLVDISFPTRVKSYFFVATKISRHSRVLRSKNKGRVTTSSCLTLITFFVAVRKCCHVVCRALTESVVWKEAKLVEFKTSVQSVLPATSARASGVLEKRCSLTFCNFVSKHYTETSQLSR